MLNFRAQTGRVWTFGYRKYGQSRHGDTANQLQPKLMETLSNLAKCAAGVYHIAFKEISNHTSRDEKLQSHCNQRGKQHLNALGQTLAGKNTAAAPLSFAKQLQEHMEAPRQMPVIITTTQQHRLK